MLLRRYEAVLLPLLQSGEYCHELFVLRTGAVRPEPGIDQGASFLGPRVYPSYIAIGSPREKCGRKHQTGVQVTTTEMHPQDSFTLTMKKSPTKSVPGQEPVGLECWLQGRRLTQQTPLESAPK